MALASTTLSAACSATDTFITVASAASFLPGRLIRVDGEWMQVGQSYVSGTSIPVLRGRDGSTTAAHQTSTNIVHGLASEFATPPGAVADSVTAPIQPALPLYPSYTAAGAIVPAQGIHIINGTATLAMTLANPTADQNGQIIIIVGAGKSVSTLTYAAGFGNAGGNYDVVTFPAGGQVAVMAIACNGFWVALSPFTGTLTSIFGAIA